MNSTIPRAQTRDLKLIASWPARVFPNHEWVLLLVLFFEIVVFSISGRQLFHGSECIRDHAAEC